MASAYMDKQSMLPESFLNSSATKYSSYSWLSRDIHQETPKGSNPKTQNKLKQSLVSAVEKTELIDFVDFEFCLDDSVNMLPAEQLFSYKKLMPLQLTKAKVASTKVQLPPPDTPKLRRRKNGMCPTTDPNLFSSNALRGSSRWKGLLGLKRLSQTEKNNQNSTFSSSTTKSLKSLLHRSSKQSSSSLNLDSSLELPLLKDSDTESVSVSSCMSLSSSSSGHEYEDPARLSLDAESNKSNTIIVPRGVIGVAKSGTPVRYKSAASSSSSEHVPTRRQQEITNYVTRGVSVDSPRMNSSGKIVFHSLERSSSTPTSHGGAKYKNRGMERSYSKPGGVFVFPLFSSSSQLRNHNNIKNRTGKIKTSAVLG